MESQNPKRKNGTSRQWRSSDRDGRLVTYKGANQLANVLRIVETKFLTVRGEDYK